jgi:hypothetical protein
MKQNAKNAYDAMIINEEIRDKFYKISYLHYAITFINSENEDSTKTECLWGQGAPKKRQDGLFKDILPNIPFCPLSIALHHNCMTNKHCKHNNLSNDYPITKSPCTEGKVEKCKTGLLCLGCDNHHTICPKWLRMIAMILYHPDLIFVQCDKREQCEDLHPNITDFIMWAARLSEETLMLQNKIIEIKGECKSIFSREIHMCDNIHMYRSMHYYFVKYIDVFEELIDQGYYAGKMFHVPEIICHKHHEGVFTGCDDCRNIIEDIVTLKCDQCYDDVICENCNIIIDMCMCWEGQCEKFLLHKLIDNRRNDLLGFLEEY